MGTGGRIEAFEHVAHTTFQEVRGWPVAKEERLIAKVKD